MAACFLSSNLRVSRAVPKRPNSCAGNDLRIGTVFAGRVECLLPEQVLRVYRASTTYRGGLQPSTTLQWAVLTPAKGITRTQFARMPFVSF